MNLKSARGQEHTFLTHTLSMIGKSGTKHSANLSIINRKILASRHIFIDLDKFTIDNPPMNEVKYDLRDSDFNQDGTIISIEEAKEKYAQEAQLNAEEEKREIEEHKHKLQQELKLQEQKQQEELKLIKVT